MELPRLDAAVYVKATNVLRVFCWSKKYMTEVHFGFV